MFLKSLKSFVQNEIKYSKQNVNNVSLTATANMADTIFYCVDMRTAFVKKIKTKFDQDTK